MRRRAFYQACLFGVFSMFWTTAPLLLAGGLETVLMVAFHRDLAQLLAMLLLTTALLAISLAILYAIDRFRAV